MSVSVCARVIKFYYESKKKKHLFFLSIFCFVLSIFSNRTFLIKREEVIFYYESFHCQDYPFDGHHCHISMWMIILSIFLIIGTIVIIILMAIYIYRYVWHERGKLTIPPATTKQQSTPTPIIRTRQNNRNKRFNPITDL